VAGGVAASRRLRVLDRQTEDLLARTWDRSGPGTRMFVGNTGSAWGRLQLRVGGLVPQPTSERGKTAWVGDQPTYAIPRLTEFYIHVVVGVRRRLVLCPGPVSGCTGPWCLSAAGGRFARPSAPATALSGLLGL